MPPTQGGQLLVQDQHGRVTIQPDVVAKIAGLAIREIAGVHALVPFGAGQALTNLARSVTNAEYRDLGVNVAVGQIEAAVDARIITSYGHSIPGIAAGIRQNVTDRISEMTGLVVKEVNIEIVDLYFDEDDQRPAPVNTARVR
jgi:uncharacterized alkaline shock family protein YloU